MKKYIIFISVGLMIAIMLCCLSPGVLNTLVDVASFFVNLWESVVTTPTAAPTPTPTLTAEGSPTACPPPPAGSKVHTVQSGETLYRLAQLYGVTVDEIARVNCITGDMIHVGQKLYVPGPTVTP